ncbi:MAG: hypothetical protein WAN69_05530, partial [Candidatus Korobacteraceae bacterium]
MAQIIYTRSLAFTYSKSAKLGTTVITHREIADLGNFRSRLVRQLVDYIRHRGDGYERFQRMGLVRHPPRDHWQRTDVATYLKDHGHDVLNPALPDDDFDAAVRIAQAESDLHNPDVIVGSSRGGAVAMNINAGPTPLILLCPAWKKWGSAKTVKPSTVVLHSKADETIPFADSQELFRNSGLRPESLIEVGHEHRLADP